MRFKGLPVVDATESLTVKKARDDVIEARDDVIEARDDVIEAWVGARMALIKYCSDPGTWVRYRLKVIA